MTDPASKSMEDCPGSRVTRGRVTGSPLVRPAVAVTACLLCGIAAAADGAETLSLGLGKIFTFFFLTLGPKAVIAPFATSTATLDASSRRNVALITTGISLVAVIIAATIGVQVLNNWGISTGALLVAAGIILFLVALDSIRSQYEVPGDADSTPPVKASARQMGFKLAFPYVVSPYGVAVVILVLTSRPETVPIAPILAMLGGIMLLNLIVMLKAQRIATSPYIAPLMAVVGSVLAVLQAALGVHAVLVGLALAGAVPS
jgi:multiple antibiotic resistance protein